MMTTAGIHDDREVTPLAVIKVVGISASGKSTLVKRLRRAGYDARPVSQEHSNVAELWQQFDKPAILIYLDADLAAQCRRRPDVSWDEQWLRQEQERLRHAWEHADLKINTAALSPSVVGKIALTFLKQERIPHAEQALAPLRSTGSALEPDAAYEPENETPLPPDRRERRKEKKLRKQQDKD